MLKHFRKNTHEVNERSQKFDLLSINVEGNSEENEYEFQSTTLLPQLIWNNPITHTTAKPEL